MIKNLKIRIIPLIVLIFASLQSFSQYSANYSDIYEVIKEGDKEKSYTLLLDYQKNNPDFANTYFQLGLIAHYWAFDFNPFTEYEYTKLFIYNTKLYFNLAQLKLAEEKKKNYDYYLNAVTPPEGEKIKMEDISVLINKKNTEILEYEQNIKEIIKYFNKSSDKYNECVTNFMTINAEYNKIKNLYLSDNEENDLRINKLKMDFDSALIYFDLYKQALNTYPVKGYNQTYVLKDIVTFRLDGLTGSNFLDNEISLWNYKKWVEEVKEIQGKIISSNKDEVFRRNDDMCKRIDKLSDASFSDTTKLFKSDEKFVYKIEKFDDQSFLIQLFKLNEGIINYLILFNKLINDPNKAQNYTLSQIATYTLTFYEEYRKVKHLNEEFVKNISPEHIKKYKNFYLTAYNGLQGLKDYSFRQDLLLKEKKDLVYKNLKDKLYNSSIDSRYDSLYFENQKIESRKRYPVLDLNSKNVNITEFKFDKNNKFVFSGFYKNKKNRLSGFSGYKLHSNKNLIISKSQENDTSDIIDMIIEPCSDGYFTIQTSTGKEIKNNLIKYNDQGKEVYSRILPFKKIPRFMFFDEINNTITVIFNGTKYNSSTENDDEQIIYIFNPDDELIKYESKFTAKATAFDIVKINNKYLLFSNYEYYLENDLKKFAVNTAGEHSRDVLITVLSVQGVIEMQSSLETGYSVLGLKAEKINSDAITILGYKTTKPDFTESTINTEELFWVIINSNTQPIYTGWHD